MCWISNERALRNGKHKHEVYSLYITFPSDLGENVVVSYLSISKLCGRGNRIALNFKEKSGS